MSQCIFSEVDLFRAIEKALNEGEFSTKFDVIKYWQANATERGANYLIFRDSEAFFKKENGKHRVALAIEFTAVIFDNDAAILGTTVLTELIQLIGRNESWGFKHVFTELSKREKFCETQGANSCEIVLEVLIKYKTNTFYLDE